MKRGGFRLIGLVAVAALVAQAALPGRMGGTVRAAGSITFDQCANGAGNGPTCTWTNGNLTDNNSTYREGDASVQWLGLTGLAVGTSHTVTVEYGSTKNGLHAYDFLTNWDWSENWITRSDQCQGITDCTLWSTSTLPIPVDPNVPTSYQSSP